MGLFTGKNAFFGVLCQFAVRLNPAEIRGFSGKFPACRTGNLARPNRESNSSEQGTTSLASANKEARLHRNRYFARGRLCGGNMPPKPCRGGGECQSLVVTGKFGVQQDHGMPFHLAEDLFGEYLDPAR